MGTSSTDIHWKEVQEAYDQALLLEDRDYIRLIAAVVLANQMPESAPVWLMLVAPPSGGKTAALMTLDNLEFLPGKPVTFFISDLTENTFASGFKSGTSESSLLKQVPFGGMLIFKDFTSLLTKRHESRDAIMGQLREIYDRKFDKKTGNNQNLAWEGKLGSLAGVTTAVHEYTADMSVLGDRYLMYTPKQPDRMKLLKFIMRMKVEGESQERKLNVAKQMMHAYLRRAIVRLKDARLYMSEDNREYLMQVADFATQVRSGVMEDQHRGHVTFVPDVEMPTRLIEQLLSIGTMLSHMHEIDGEVPDLTEKDMKILYKIAFDSIPIKRRWALRAMAEYVQGVTTAQLGVRMGYETEVAKRWLSQLAALGICRRLKNGGGADLWILNEQYFRVMQTFEGVESKDEMLIDQTENDDEAYAQNALRDLGDLESMFED